MVVIGRTPAGKRSTLVGVFGTPSESSRSVLSNCACLGEDVDVPVLDGVTFIDPKRSMIDIIQSVGRVIRKAEDKRIGTVVIPVFVDESEDAAHALSSSAFEPVWQVLKALRAHDDRLADELDQLRLKLGKRSPYGGRIRLPEKIKVDVPTLLLEDFEQAFYVRTVEMTTRMPPLTEAQILGNRCREIGVKIGGNRCQFILPVSRRQYELTLIYPDLPDFRLFPSDVPAAMSPFPPSLPPIEKRYDLPGPPFHFACA